MSSKKKREKHEHEDASSSTSSSTSKTTEPSPAREPWSGKPSQQRWRIFVWREEAWTRLEDGPHASETTARLMSSRHRLDRAAEGRTWALAPESETPPAPPPPSGSEEGSEASPDTR